jgi:hypothetical protein
MQYMIMNFVPPAKIGPDGAPEYGSEMALWEAYTKALVDAGVMRGGNALHAGTTATTVRVRAGQRDIHDGPYADSKEELGGYFIIEVDSLDEALLWAARNPAASTGAVEVRPIVTY